jgi:UDP-N-acetylmuramoyl-L-alanyl-D-glutamate--2,6-diaminopimelate ligase
MSMFRFDSALRVEVGARGFTPGADLAAWSRVTSDSRKAGPGVAFVAVRGEHADGHDFLEAALAAGAPVVVVQEDRAPAGAPCVTVADSRLALAILAARVEGDPSRGFLMAGVTGTDGKTSTAMLLEAGFLACGLVPGLIGTVEYRYAGVRESSGMTTPGPLELQALFGRMRDRGVNAVAMEVSSHALDQRRVEAIRFAVAILTVLTRDHLDYHGTIDNYRGAKERLFTELLPANPDAKGAVVNGDDAFGRHLKTACPLPVVTFSLAVGGGDLCPEAVTYDLEGIRGRICTPWGSFDVDSPLIGPHNLANLLAAIGAAGLLGLDLVPFVAGVCAVSRIPGRLERVRGRRNVRVYVDYAHTPKALENVLTVLRPMVGASRLTVVMGAGGDRDRGKRPLMGRASALLADRVVVTSDNPRSEDPDAIIEAIVAGIVAARDEGLAVAPFEVQPDRRAAIERAILGASDGDVVVVAGKGHEDYQILGARKVHFSDVETAKEILDA